MRNFSKKSILILAVFAQIFVGACSQKADKIQPTYTSPLIMRIFGAVVAKP